MAICLPPSSFSGLGGRIVVPIVTQPFGILTVEYPPSTDLVFDSIFRYASQLSDIPVPGRQPPTALEEAAVHMAIGSDGSLSVIDFCKPLILSILD